MWRYNMAGFLLGALPQAVKVFSMSGVFITQACIGVLLVSFIVPEIFRSIAGPAGKFDLHLVPAVQHAKKSLEECQRIALISACIVNCMVWTGGTATMIALSSEPGHNPRALPSCFYGISSRIPRKLSGLEGTNSEFVSGAFFGLNFVCTFMAYAFFFYNEKGTSKPAWAEYLG